MKKTTTLTAKICTLFKMLRRNYRRYVDRYISSCIEKKIIRYHYALSQELRLHSI